MTRGVRLGRLAGVELVADWSALAIVALAAASLGLGVLPRWHPDWGLPLLWGVAGVAAVLFVASLIAHELGHALVARGRGVPVDRITLFLLGGVSRMNREPRRPRDELAIAVAGPLVSFAIGLSATMLGAALATSGEGHGSARALLRSLGPGTTLLLWIGPINIALGLFNLIPGFPLDGGRVLRAILWSITSDLRTATRWAAAVGRAMALLIIAFGALLAIRGDILSGLWLVLIGWFLDSAALMSRQHHDGRAALTGVPVSAVMQQRFDAVDPSETVGELMERHLLRGTQRAFPVCFTGELLGLVSIADLRRAPQSRWDVTPVTEVMTPVERLAMVGPETPAFEALEQLGEQEVAQLPVIDRRGGLVGILAREDVVRWLALRDELSGGYRL